jgi:anti-sigma regulatory factor (Ser/Thr protein kinase)
MNPLPAGELHVRLRALRETVGPLRATLRSFLEGLRLDRSTIDDVLTAAGEMVANVVEHAYAGETPGTVELIAREVDGHALFVEISDSGSFIERAAPVPGRGFGLRISRAIARSHELDTSSGTMVRMMFDLPSDAARRTRSRALGRADTQD